MWESLHTVRKYLWRYRRGMALGGLCLVMKDLAQALQPLMIRAAVDHFRDGGFMRYAAGQGWRPFVRLMTAYLRFMWSLIAANLMHKSLKRRTARRRLHHERLEASAMAGGVTLETAKAIDRLSRAPLTISWRRLGRLLVLDKWLMVGGTLLSSLILLFTAPRWVFLLGLVICIVATVIAQIRLGKHMVTSQLPMRAVPRRLRDLVEDMAATMLAGAAGRWDRRFGGYWPPVVLLAVLLAAGVKFG